MRAGEQDAAGVVRRKMPNPAHDVKITACSVHLYGRHDLMARTKADNRIAVSASLRLKPVDSSAERKIAIDKDDPLLASYSCFFAPNQGQLQCYRGTCSDIVAEFTNGRNCTLFVYGQTGSGKTHTLFGPPNSFHDNSLSPDHAKEVFQGASIPNSWGLFPRIVLHLLHATKSSAMGVTATAVEIYMDQCYDLMNDKQRIAVAGYGRSAKTSGRGSFLETTEVKRDGNGRWIPPRTLVDKPLNEGYGLRGAKSLILKDCRMLLDFMRVVEVRAPHTHALRSQHDPLTDSDSLLLQATRTSKSHKLNERSSRSHCVITLSMPSISGAKFMCVDLAGSERIVKSGTIENELKAAEARNINTSLTTLGRCISALASGSAFVPYRDSVLTMLLKQSLGGACCTSVIVTGSEDMEMQSETISSMKFGQRCAKVANREQRHEPIDKGTTIHDLHAELKVLDKEIEEMVASGNAGGLNATFPKSLRESFTTNLGKFQSHKAALQRCKQSIKSGRTGLDQTHAFEESQVRNLQGILLRSMTTGVWSDPCPRYIKKVQRRIDIITLLAGMGENVSSIPSIEVPLTFGHLMLGFEG